MNAQPQRFTAIARGLLMTLLAIFSVGVSSCFDDRIPNPIDRVKLVDAIRIGSVTQKLMKDIMATKPEFSGLINYIQHDITLYRIIYKTEFKGKTIQASGLISLPKGLENAPIMSAQHGTIFAENSAPSNFLVNVLTGGQVGFELFGATGFITVIPDFIGYGRSGNIVHPYFDRALTASATIDMLIASKEFLTENNLTFSDKLFLFGYSEGGFATLATLRELEENSTYGISVTASAAGAGGFDIQGIMDHVLHLETHPEPGFLGYVVRSYNETYEWKRPYTDFFKEPYASRIEDGLLDGNYTKEEVNERLTTKLDSLLNPSFEANLTNGSDTLVLKAMEQNSVHNWVPQGKVRLYHSPQDEVLTITNTINTYNNMLSLGAKDLEFVQLGGTSHATAALKMIEEVMPWFISLK
jgi:pimeloyl-ACP methyl ester carboxylesterase